jgi:hypothetical protein
VERSELVKLGEQVRVALDSADLTSFSHLMAPDVHWGPGDHSAVGCQNREEVVRWWQKGRDAGRRATVTEVVPGTGRLLVGLAVAGLPDELGGGTTRRWQVLTVSSGQITDIRGFDDRHAAAILAGVDA